MKIYFLPLIVLLISFSACKKVDRLTQFELDYNETIEIPATLGIHLPFNIPTPEITSHSQSAFELNKTQKRWVEEIRLKELVLTVKVPAYADFSFLESIEIFIKTEKLPEKKIASNLLVPDDTGNVLELEAINTDLQEYIKADEFFLKVKTVTDELLTSDHEIDIHCVFFVDAKILGQ